MNKSTTILTINNVTYFQGAKALNNFNKIKALITLADKDVIAIHNFITELRQEAK